MRRDVTTWPEPELTIAHSYFLFFSRFPNSCFYLALGSAHQILSLDFQPVGLPVISRVKGLISRASLRTVKIVSDLG